MQIPANQIVRKKQVGKDGDGVAVIEIETKGGFHLIADGNGKILGTGPHKAVAKHIARKRRPGIEWSELSKADWIEPEHFQHLVPDYEAVTDRMNELAEE